MCRALSSGASRLSSVSDARSRCTLSCIKRLGLQFVLDFNIYSSVVSILRNVLQCVSRYMLKGNCWEQKSVFRATNGVANVQVNGIVGNQLVDRIIGIV